MGTTKIVFTKVLFLLFVCTCTCSSKAATRIKAGYWLAVSEFPIDEVEATLFTHLICGFAAINSSTFHLSIPQSDLQYLSSFSSTVKRRNPTAITLLSIGDVAIVPVFLSLLPSSSHRDAFVKSTVQMARAYGFDGLDLACLYRRPQPNTTTAMVDHLGTLFDEWRIAVDSEAQRSNKTRLILTMTVYYTPSVSDSDNSYGFPVDSMQKNLDWVNILAFDYYIPTREETHTHFHAALYDPLSNTDTDFGVRKWIRSGLSKDKIVLGLPYHGYAWTLSNPSKNNSLGAPASGPAITLDGSISYSAIRRYAHNDGEMVYNSTYVEGYWTSGSFWVCFDDVVAIKRKVSYAVEKGLLGYFVFQVANDDQWVLSQAASDQMDGKNNANKRLVLVTAVIPVALFALLLPLIWCFKGRLLLYIGNRGRNSNSNSNSFSSNSSDLIIFSYKDIRAATKDFSFENKLGEGGYGPVYKGKLRNGQDIAVKRLSKTSSQGYEEFKNEVMLTAKLQHVNLVKLIGFCMDRDEKMLIYEFLPNKSLDLYLFDPLKTYALDWEKRAKTVEGIIQGLLYLQEYSRLTIIHRDLKASNILMDKDLLPKISDFGMARIFQKDEYEANTDRIVGTYGYVPPEYVKQGVYSTKYDVYSFGVLLLQIISGKRNNCFYGVNENLNLLDYAYELWEDGRAAEFMDPALDDSNSKYKLERCLQMALLCVQKRQEDRPSMLEVSSTLWNENEPIMRPKRPAFSVKRDEEDLEGLAVTSGIGMCTFSGMEPR